ncbi:hypothetical protein IAT40_004707 [Kwoniella sp. CBS 6097]
MRYKNLLSLSTNAQPVATTAGHPQQPPPPDLHPTRHGAPPIQAHDESSKGKKFRFGSGGVKSKLHRAFSLSKQPKEQPRFATTPQHQRPEDVSAAVPSLKPRPPILRRPTIHPRKPDTLQFKGMRRDGKAEPTIVTERTQGIPQLAPGSRHSWHADTFLSFLDEIDHSAPAPLCLQEQPRTPPRLHRKSLDMLTGRHTDSFDPAVGLDTSASSSREIEWSSHQRENPAPVSRCHNSPPQVKSRRPKSYRPALGERDMNPLLQASQQVFFHERSSATSAMGKMATSGRLKLPISRDSTPKQHRRKPVPSVATPHVQAYNPSQRDEYRSTPTASPVRAWEPLNVSRHVTPAKNVEKYNMPDVLTTPHTPPTPYFSPLNDVSPNTSLSSEAWWNESSPSPSIVDPQLESQSSFELGQEKLFEDVLTSWGLASSSSDLDRLETRSELGWSGEHGARMTRSQSIPLNLHDFQHVEVETAAPKSITPHRYMSQPSLSASTSRLLSDRSTYQGPHIDAHAAPVLVQQSTSGLRLAKDPPLRTGKKEISPGPRFYPSGRSFATIRAVKPSLRFSKEEGEEELPFVSRPVKMKGKLQGKVRNAVARFEGSREDSPSTPTRPLREIGEILSHQSSVSSLDLGSGARKMMAEAREKRFRLKQWQ